VDGAQTVFDVVLVVASLVLKSLQAVRAGDDEREKESSVRSTRPLHFSQRLLVVGLERCIKDWSTRSRLARAVSRVFGCVILHLLPFLDKLTHFPRRSSALNAL
jgi:hypothetical protein